MMSPAQAADSSRPNVGSLLIAIWFAKFLSPSLSFPECRHASLHSITRLGLLSLASLGAPDASRISRVRNELLGSGQITSDWPRPARPIYDLIIHRCPGSLFPHRFAVAELDVLLKFLVHRSRNPCRIIGREIAQFGRVVSSATHPYEIV